MSKALRQYVIKSLVNYSNVERQIQLLQCELLLSEKITSNEMLEVMAFEKGEGGNGPKGYVSDKTASVAMRYRERANELNEETRRALMEQLIPLRSQKDRLDRCIMLLSPMSKSILVGFYMNKRTIKDLALELHLSERTIQRYRDNAIDEVVSMYELLERIGVVIE